MIIIAYGDEPYLIRKEKEKVIMAIENRDMNLLKNTMFSEDVLQFLNTYPFMSSRKAALLDVDSLSLLDNKLFRSYLEAPSAFSDLFVQVRSFDARTKIATELKKLGIVKKCSKLEKENELVSILLAELNHAKGRITHDAMKEFLYRENYFDAEINLLDMVNDLKMLISIDSDITLPMVKTYVKSNETENCFAIAKMIAAKDIMGLKKQSLLMGAEDAIKVLSLLMREYRIAWKVSYGVLKNQKYAVFKGRPASYCFNGIKICQEAIDSIKNGTMPAENALSITFSKLI